MSFLYKITIYPLEVFYKYLYLFFVNVSGSYFWSLVFLSIFTTLLFIPIRRFTTKIQNKQKLLNSILEPQLKLINEKYIGEEKHRQVTALYKRYAYHPIYSLRSSLGVLIQVPFLIATYYMILDCDLLFYEPFYFINDLSKPDKLLFGINVLPFVMTFFNIVAGYFLLNMSRKEHVQLYFIAGLFLLLLYSSPSALLIYWTFNNFFTLILNFISFWQNLTETDKILFKNKVNSFFKENILFIFLFVCLIALSFVAYFGEEEKYIVLKWDPIIRYHKYLLLVLFFTFLISLYPFIQIFKNKSSDNAYILQVGTVFIVVGYFLYLLSYFFISGYELVAAAVIQDADLLYDAKQKITVQKVKGFIYVFACFSFFTTYVCYKNNFKIKINKLLRGDSFKLYWLSCFFLVLFVMFYSPISLYISDKTFYSNNIFPLLKYFALNSIILIFISFLLWVFIPKKHKDKIAILSFAFSLLAVLYSTIFIPDTGVIFAGVFDSSYNILGLPSRMGDVVSVLIVLYLIVLFTSYRIMNRIFIFLKVIVLVLLLVNIYNITTEGLISYRAFFQAKPKPTESAQIKFENFSPQYQELFSFHKNEPNVLVVVLDSFTGAHVGYLLEEHPEIVSNYKGFTWYADTLAVGSLTATGLPSIYGGENYGPKKINEIDDYLINKIAKAYAVIPRNFSKKGFDVKLLNYGVSYNNVTFKKEAGSAQEAMMYWPLNSDYNSEIIKYFIESGEVKLDLMANTAIINWYKFVPSFIRDFLYADGTWRRTNELVNKIDSIKDLSVFYNLNKFVNNKAEKPTVKYIYSGLTHHPWVLDESFSLPEIKNVTSEGVRNKNKKLGSQLIQPSNYYYTEMHALNILNNLFIKMQDLGVYDNTLIILTADHGFSTFPKMPKNGLKHGSALFMVKEIGAEGIFKSETHKFMQTSDTAAIVCEVIGGCDEVPPLAADLSKNRIRYIYDGPSIIYGNRVKIYKPLVEYKNQGPIFEEESWQPLENKQNQ